MAKLQSDLEDLVIALELGQPGELLTKIEDLLIEFGFDDHFEEITRIIAISEDYTTADTIDQINDCMRDSMLTALAEMNIRVKETINLLPLYEFLEAVLDLPFQDEKEHLNQIFTNDELETDQMLLEAVDYTKGLNTLEIEPHLERVSPLVITLLAKITEGLTYSVSLGAEINPDTIKSLVSKLKPPVLTEAFEEGLPVGLDFNVYRYKFIDEYGDVHTLGKDLKDPLFKQIASDYYVAWRASRDGGFSSGNVTETAGKRLDTAGYGEAVERGSRVVIDESLETLKNLIGEDFERDLMAAYAITQALMELGHD